MKGLRFASDVVHRLSTLGLLQVSSKKAGLRERILLCLRSVIPYVLVNLPEQNTFIITSRREKKKVKAAPKEEGTEREEFQKLVQVAAGGVGWKWKLRQLLTLHYRNQ